MELSLTSFDNGDGFPCFIRLSVSLFFEVWKEFPYEIILGDPDIREEEGESLITY